jgi:hypothetical protein
LAEDLGSVHVPLFKQTMKYVDAKMELIKLFSTVSFDQGFQQFLNDNSDIASFEQFFAESTLKSNEPTDYLKFIDVAFKFATEHCMMKDAIGPNAPHKQFGDSDGLFDIVCFYKLKYILETEIKFIIDMSPDPLIFEKGILEATELPQVKQNPKFMELLKEFWMIKFILNLPTKFLRFSRSKALQKLQDLQHYKSLEAQISVILTPQELNSLDDTLPVVPKIKQYF